MKIESVNETVEQVKSKPEKFNEYAKEAIKIIEAWTEWKKKTRATSYPREVGE